MDQISYDVLKELNLTGIIPVHVDELITPEINKIRNNTTHGQFCWVCQPLLCEFILDRFRPDMITYLEADSMFFADPEILFDEFGDNNNVSLVPHSYSQGFDQTIVSGKYCVQFNAFRNNDEAKAVLNYWRLRCFEYSKDSLSNFPGQTCLDFWPILFKGVKIIEHPGAGVAVWNIQHRKFTTKNVVPQIDGYAIVFYHYHQYKIYANGYHDLGIYPLTNSAIEAVYREYVKQVFLAMETVNDKYPEFASKVTYTTMVTFKHVVASFNWSNLKQYLRRFKRKSHNIDNIFSDSFFE